MKMSKNYRRLCAVLGLSLVCGTGMVTATSGSKTVQATYRNIQITYNGQSKVVTDEQGRVVEPFAINGTTYVPLRGVGQIFGAGVDWDPNTSTVILTGGSSSSSTADVSAYLTKINDLQNQLTAAQNELATLKKGSSSTTNTPTTTTDITLDQLQATETYLNDQYAEYISGISFDIDLKRSSTKFIVDLSYSRSSENNTFDKLSKRNLDRFLEDLCQALSSRHAGFSIEGTVSYSNTEKYNFTCSKSGVYAGEAIIELDEDDVEDYITDNKNLDSRILSTITIQNASVSVSDSKETITCSLYMRTPSDDDMAKWNNASSDRSLENNLKELSGDIQDQFNTKYDIVFYLYDESSNAKIATYKNGDLSLGTWKK